MAGTGNSSFLYSVGVDTTQPAATLRDFAAKTAPGFLDDAKPFEVRTSSASAMSSRVSSEAKCVSIYQSALSDGIGGRLKGHRRTRSLGRKRNLFCPAGV
jgi:hypothetical protein